MSDDPIAEALNRETCLKPEGDSIKNITAISRENEIKTPYAINEFGSRQLILDFYVPNWIFELDKSITEIVQKPAIWKEKGGCFEFFFNSLYYIAKVVNGILI